MKMNLIDIFKEVKDSFCSLWNYKLRGDTIEVITPLTSPTSKFISVFITKRNDSFIVTDGGWLMSGEYLDSELINSDNFQPLIKFFEGHYSLKTIKQGYLQLFYKTTNDFNLVPNVVHDISQFVSQILITCISKFNDEQIKEIKETERFGTSVDYYIKGIVKRDVLFRHEFPEKDEGVRFNAIVKYADKVSLVKYITGSDSNYFIKNITKATADFRIVDDSVYKTFVKAKVAIFNDSARGFITKRFYRYVEQLEERIERPIVRWSQKEELEGIL